MRIPLLLAAVVLLSACQADPPEPRETAYSASPFGIPVIDMTDDASRRSVVDRQDGQYLGHPTTVLLEDSTTILTVYPMGHGRGAIVYKRSEDAGLSWSERLPVPDNWATSQETPTLYRTVDANGTRRLLVFSGLYPIRMAVSEDDGATWSPLEPIGDFGGIVAMSSMADLGQGRYVAFFHDDGRFLRGAGVTDSFQVFATRSNDGGLTWSEPEIIAEHPEAHLCEPGLVWSPDGTEMALLLRENSRTHASMVIFSADSGATWSSPLELSNALTGDRHTARYGADGRLVVTFRDQAPGSPTWGDWVVWVGAYEDLHTGGEGLARIRLLDNHKDADCCYPGLERLPDDTFVATTYGHWTPGAEPYIVSVRFTLDEIDAEIRSNTP